MQNLLDSHEYLQRLYWDIGKIKELKLSLIEMTNEICSILQQAHEFPEYLHTSIITESEAIVKHFSKLISFNKELEIICNHLQKAVKSSIDYYFSQHYNDRKFK